VSPCYFGDLPDLILVPIPVSILEVREHFKTVDADSIPTADEMRYLTDLTFKLVPTIRVLERYAESLTGKPKLS
jgi:hypothetical protein